MRSVFRLEATLEFSESVMSAAKNERRTKKTSVTSPARSASKNDVP